MSVAYAFEWVSLRALDEFLVRAGPRRFCRSLMMYDSCHPFFVLLGQREVIYNMFALFPLHHLPSNPQFTSRLGCDRVPLEKDKVWVILFLELLKFGVVATEELLCAHCGTRTSLNSRVNFFGV
jgi:hypothetical protein